MSNEALVRIEFNTVKQHGVTADEVDARSRLQAAIEAEIERFQVAYPKSEVIGIEMHPCACDECKAAAA